MSYIVNDGSEQHRSRRPLLLGIAVLVVLALVVTAFLIGRAGSDSGGPGASPAPGLGGSSITWSKVGWQPVPGSPVHGPAQTGNGLASGFSHDELGAALAAINISTRLSSAAGPMVYETTARLQAFGDIDATISTLRSQRSSSAPGAAAPTEYFYRISSGEPTGDVVVVSVAASTPQSSTMGGYAELSRTLQWVDGDWKVQVPFGPLRLIPSVADYTSLGRPDA